MAICYEKKKKKFQKTNFIRVVIVMMMMIVNFRGCLMAKRPPKEKARWNNNDVEVQFCGVWTSSRVWLLRWCGIVGGVTMELWAKYELCEDVAIFWQYRRIIYASVNYATQPDMFHTQLTIWRYGKEYVQYFPSALDIANPSIRNRP